jgi:hypothetical protein
MQHWHAEAVCFVRIIKQYDIWVLLEHANAVRMHKEEVRNPISVQLKGFHSRGMSLFVGRISNSEQLIHDKILLLSCAVCAHYSTALSRDAELLLRTRSLEPRSSVSGQDS